MKNVSSNEFAPERAGIVSGSTRFVLRGTVKISDEKICIEKLINFVRKEHQCGVGLR